MEPANHVIVYFSVVWLGGWVLLIACAVFLARWGRKGRLPPPVRAAYPLRTKLLALVPLVTTWKQKVAPEHHADFSFFRRRFGTVFLVLVPVCALYALMPRLALWVVGHAMHLDETPTCDPAPDAAPPTPSSHP
jgi:hypothetical protein